MKRLFFLHIFIFLNLIVFSQAEEKVNYDLNSNIKIRTSESINDFLNDDYYNYDNEAPVETESIWQKFWRKVSKLFQFLERGGKPVSYTFYAVLIIILIIAITKLLGINYQGLILKSKNIASSEFEIFDEDIYNTDFDKLIEDAENQENYRTAIRYLYIKFLKILANNELIEWEINKTNKDYKNELKKTKYFSAFKHLTLVYEYVWYGEFEINKIKYNKYLKNYKKIFADF
ncbi:MAG: hypothetical protein L3J35_06230 [Bacteroidales bacterium]|nr:hypothetical protein [Bacteroidales bacterium]